MTSDSFHHAGVPLSRENASRGKPVFLEKHGFADRSLAWGMWRLSGETAPARKLVETTLDAGIRLLDTADIYGDVFGDAEVILGRVLKDAPDLRKRMVLATKAGIIPGVPYCSSEDYLVAACEQSLKRMGVEQIDLYQIHRPDHLTHPQEVASAFSRLRRAGKIVDAGVSNHTPSQIRALAAHMDFPLSTVQPELSAVAIEAVSDGVLDLAMELDLAVLAWSPLGRGALASGVGLPRADAVCVVLDRLGAREGVSRAAMAFAWIMAHPASPVPIIGSQKGARIIDAVDALKVNLSRADWYEVLVAARGERLP